MIGNLISRGSYRVNDTRRIECTEAKVLVDVRIQNHSHKIVGLLRIICMVFA